MPSETTITRASPPRILSVDALRGLVMIIMALDHVRDFFHADAMVFSPEDLSRTSAILFFTRWVTHICAPVFFFTAGVGAFFWASRGRTAAHLSRFLWQRGLWLVLLDVTASRVAMNFSLSGLVILNVLWALGWCMVLMGFLVRLPVRWLAVLSTLSIAFHNLLDPVQANTFGAASWLWKVVHAQGLLNILGAPVIVAYPLVPWVAVMAAGYCFGTLLRMEARVRQRWMLVAGTAMVVSFAVLRAINLYGDSRPWSSSPASMVVFSFLRCTKYPPSLDFLLMTLGPGLLLLAWFDRIQWKPTSPLLVFGRVPLFYFVLHLYLAHVLAFPLAYLRYGRVAFLFGPAPSMGGASGAYPEEYGYPLWSVYLIWIAVVTMLYPLCRYFGELKKRRNDWWLSYL